MNRKQLVAKLEALHATATAENRELTADEQRAYDETRDQIHKIDEQPDPLKLHPAPAPAVITRSRGYSLARAIGYALGDSNAGDVGLEREMHVHLSKSRPNAKGVLVPIGAIFAKAGQSTLTASPSVGSVLATTDRLMVDLMTDSEDAIRKATILGPLGVSTVVIPDAQAARIPRKVKGSVAGWVGRDAAAGAAQDLEFDDIDAEPHTLAIQAKLNRSSLIYTVPSMEQVVRSDIALAVGDGLNDGFLNASGPSAAPDGLLAVLTADSRDITGKLNGTPDRKDFLDFVTDNVDAYAEDPQGRSWLMHPTVVNYISTTPAWTGAQIAISDGRTLGTLPIVQSGRAEATPVSGDPTPYVVVGDWAQAFVFMFGPALDVQANPYHDDVWASGGILLRGLLDLGFVFRDTKRFAMAGDAL